MVKHNVEKERSPPNEALHKKTYVSLKSTIFHRCIKRLIIGFYATFNEIGGQDHSL